MKGLDIPQHKLHMTTILMEIYKDTLLSSRLGFKGGTAAMLFYNLPRFSVDLDFDLTDHVRQNSEDFKTCIEVINKVLEAKYEIKDRSTKYNTLFWLISYGKHLRNLKIEVSTREQPHNTYILKSLYGVSIKLLDIRDMIAHKLIALSERKTFANRDLFDVHYFLTSLYATDINYSIIKHRTGKEALEFYRALLKYLEKVDNKHILNGLGEILTESQKSWARDKLLIEVRGLIERQIDYVS